MAIEQGKSGASLGLVLRTLFALGIALDGSDLPPKKQSSPDTPDIDVIIEAARRRSR